MKASVCGAGSDCTQARHRLLVVGYTFKINIYLCAVSVWVPTSMTA
jgi:hypothetical protein